MSRRVLIAVLTVLIFSVTLLVPVVTGFFAPPTPGPVANAGPPQFVPMGSTVVLDGSRSTSGTGAPLSYQWSFVSVPAGASPALSDAAAISPTFVVSQDGPYVVGLTVSDGTSTSSAQVVVSTQVTPPIADAGSNQSVVPGALVQLNGGASSDPDGDALSFQWTWTSKPAGSLASFSNSAAVAPTFLADATGTYVAQLTVTDAHGKSASASVTISTADLPPIARAGNSQSVTIGATVHLDGSASSDPNGDPITYQWTFLAKPSASAASLSANNVASPTFVADAPGTYVLQLAVTDSHSNVSLSALKVTTDPIPPTAKAGTQQSVSVGATVQLNGSGSSDAGGAALTFVWSMLSKPSGSTAALPSGINSATRSFVADQPGEYLVQLVVSNSMYTSSPSTVLVTAAGSGGRLILSPNPIAFGNQAVLTTGGPVGLTITNPSNSAVQISGFLTSGANAGDFNVSGAQLPLTVNSHGAVLLKIFFTPHADGPRSAALIVNDSTDGVSFIVPMTGTGGTAVPSISLVPTSIVFGDQAVGTLSAASRLTINNPGSGDLQITGLSFNGANPTDFSFPISFSPPTPASPLVVPANGGSASIPIQFSPAATGARTASLVIADNAAGSPHTVALSGNGVPGGPAVITVSPASLAFPDQVVGSPSSPLNVTVTNTGGTSAQVTSVSFTGANNGDFATTAVTPITVAAGGTATIPVKLTPSATGPRTATLTVFDNTGGSAHTVALSGNGISTPPGLSVTPTEINFPIQAVGTTSSPAPVTIANNTAKTVQITSVLLLGDNAGDFLVTGARAPFSLPAGQSAIVNVLFSPKADGARSARVVISDDTTGTAHAVALAGNVSGGTANVTLTPSSLTFPDTGVGSTSASLTVVVKNAGTASITINHLVKTGANPGDFFYAVLGSLPSSDFPETLAPGASVNMTVNFRPVSTGSRVANFVLQDVNGATVATLPLSGNGVPNGPAVINVNASSIAFPDQPVGTTSSPLNITVTNAGGSSAQITGLTISGTASGDFSTTSVAPITVAAGASITIPVKFTPSAAGARSATLTIADNTGGSSHSVTLSGNGVTTPPGFSVNPSSITFPTQAVGTTSSPVAITISNNTAITVQVTSLLLLGDNASDFLVTGARAPFSLSQGQSAIVNVLFSPKATTPRSARLVISDDTGGAPHSVSLTGNNVGTPGFGATPPSLTFADTTVGAPSAALSTNINNPGDGPLVISGLSFAGANAGDFVFPAGFTLPTAANPITVVPGGITAIPVIFKPTGTGARVAALVSTDNAAGSPHTVGLSGNGVPGGPAVIAVSPASLAYPDQTVGVASSPLNVTVSNTGGTSAQVTGLSLTGANNVDFSTTSVAPITVPAGGSVTIPLRFTPSATGTRSATLTITDSSGGAPHSVGLSGKGVLVIGIIVNPTSIDFQNQTLNTASAPATVVIQNTSPNLINVTGFVLAGFNASDFTVAAPKAPWPIASNGSFSFNVLFTPKDLGTRSATIILNDDSGGVAHTVSLSGTGATGVPTITLNPNALSFPNQSVGTASAPMSFTISNAGTSALLIKSISFGGTNPADFILPANFTPPTPANPISIAINGSTTISAIFQPTASGTRTASLLLTDNANNSPHSVGLSGNGTAPGIALNPSPLVFADQNVGTASAPATLTITNSGNGILTITGLSFGGSNATDFAFPVSFVVPTPATPLSIAPNGGTATLAVIFAPQSAGDRSASLIIADNAPGAPHNVALSGKGLPSTIAVNPTSLDFGTVLQGHAATPLPVTVTNTGSSDVQITGLAMTGDNATDFSVQESGTINVPANGAVTLHVGFQPAATGTRTGTMVITDTAAGSPHSVPLTGISIAPAFTISPTIVTFADQTVPSTSSPVTLLVRNTGSAPLHITSVTFGGTNPGDFQTSTPGPVVVDANNGTTTLSITFAPTAVGSRSATLVINDDASGSPHTVALTGKGVGLPLFSITPTSLDFGSVAANTTSTPQLLHITNTGSADLTIEFVSRSGANPSEFRYAVLGTLGSSDFPETLAPGASVDVNIFFSPSDGGGSRNAVFIFHDNAANSPQSVAVTGTSIPSPPRLTISPPSLTFSPQQLNTTSGPLSLNLQNTGGATLNITNIAFTGPNGSEFAAAPLAPLTIPGGGTASISVTFTPGGTGTRSATLNLSDNSGGSAHTDTIPVSGTGANSVGTISLPAFSLGGNLETLASASLDQAPGNDLTVTITSSDSSKLLLSPVSSDPQGTQPGLASITGIVPKGQGRFGFGFPGFWAQALVSSGTAQITVSAPGYNSGVATVTFTHSGIVLISSAGVGGNFTTTADAFLTAGSVQLDSSGNQIGTQALRGGLVANIAVNSGTPATGTILNSPAVLQPGKSTSSQVTFHPVAPGTSTLSIPQQPNGFFAPNTGTQLTALVVLPSIVVTPQSIGYNLVAQGSAHLDTAAPNGGLQVTLSSSNTSKLLLSTTPSGAGQASINLQVQAGSTTIPAFYLQALSSTGSATINATASGYTSGSANVALFPTAFVINSPGGGTNFTTTTISPSTPLTLTVWQLDTNSRPFISGQLRPGVSESITVNSSNSAAGGVTGNPALFQGGDVLNGTLSFLPSQNCSAPCTSVLSVSQPGGYGSPATGGSITATVNQPRITVRMIQSTVGKDLQVSATGALDAPAPSDITVTISSNSSNVLLSPSPTVVGSSSVSGTVFSGSGVNSIGFPTYYVQALANSGTATLTASAPGFASTTFVVTLAPSGFVISGPNGVGANFGTLAANGNVALNIMPVVLNSNTLSPTVLNEAVRAGASASVTVASNASGVAAIRDTDTPAVFNPGDTSASVTLIPTGPGQAVISATTPGFTSPSSGAQLTVTVN